MRRTVQASVEANISCGKSEERMRVTRIELSPERNFDVLDYASQSMCRCLVKWTVVGGNSPARSANRTAGEGRERGRLLQLIDRV